MPANLQVGEDRATVYTTKIMLALNRVSELQWQPFMVRVRINIAGSKALGGEGGREVYVNPSSATHLWVQPSLHWWAHWPDTSAHRMAARTERSNLKKYNRWTLEVVDLLFQWGKESRTQIKINFMLTFAHFCIIYLFQRTEGEMFYQPTVHRCVCLPVFLTSAVPGCH